MKNYFKDYLNWSEEALVKAINIGKNESILYEFDFSIVDALRALSETKFLLAEYRTRATSYKYVIYHDLEKDRKLKNLEKIKKETNK